METMKTENEKMLKTMNDDLEKLMVLMQDR
jgi:hypothetical protein